MGGAAAPLCVSVNAVVRIGGLFADGGLFIVLFLLEGLAGVLGGSANTSEVSPAVRSRRRLLVSVSLENTGRTLGPCGRPLRPNRK